MKFLEATAGPSATVAADALPDANADAHGDVPALADNEDLSACEGQPSAVKRPADAELGAAAKKLRDGAVSEGTAAPASLTRFSRGAEIALRAMETHLTTFSFSDAEARATSSRVGAAEPT